MTWSDHIAHGLGVLSQFIFAGAGLSAIGITFATVQPQLGRIAALLRGYPVPPASSVAPTATCRPTLRAVEAGDQPTQFEVR